MGRRFVLWPLVMSLAAGLVLSASAPASAYGRSSLQVDVGFFYSDLDPYGDWVEVNDYGHCWVPSVERSWRPYSRGHWALTDDYGWFWASDEPFGWATYHYGRWYLDPMYGWVWVPGYEWGPSWVSWRYGSGYVGWAPLPPRVSWSVGFGFRTGGAEIDAYISPRAYSFVEERAFVDTGVYRRVLPVERNTTIIRATENVTDYRAVGDRVVARGPRVERVEQVVGHRVPRHRVVDVSSVQEVRRGHRQRDAVAVFRPEVRKSDAVPHPRAERRGLREQQREAQGAQRQERLNLERQHRFDQRDIDRQRQQEQHQAERQRRLDQQEQRQLNQQEARRRQRDDQARQNLEKRQARQRQETEQRHQQEMRNRRDVAEIERSQREEHRAMAEQQRQERQQQAEQARQERQGAREQRAQQVEESRQQARQERRGAREERQQQAERRGQPRKEQAAQKKERDKDKGNDRPDKNK